MLEEKKIPAYEELSAFIIYADGTRVETTVKESNDPIAVFIRSIERYSCLPTLCMRAEMNLMGRMLTIVDAVTDDPMKREAVKSIVRKELKDWSSSLQRDATEIGHGGNSSENIYSRNSKEYQAVRG